MTSQYLNLSASTQLDSNGNGVAVLKPDANEFWAPDFLRVSTASQKVPFAYCAVYHVSPGVTIGPTSFIDDTYGGNNDTSSIISGTIVQFGESIVAQFTGGTPGDTAVLSIYGMHSDLPIGMDVLPSSPGTHFSNRLNFASDIPALIDSASFATLTHGASTFYPSTSTTYQTSRYQSFKLKLNCSGTGNKSYFGVQIQWFFDSAGTNQISTEYFVFSSNTNDQYGQGIVRGPFLRLRVFNYDNIDSSFSFSLYGSQRSEVRTQFRTLQSLNAAIGVGTDNILMSSIVTNLAANGGAQYIGDFNFYNGPVTINVWCSTTPNATKVIDVVIFALPNGILADDNIYEFYIPQSTADFKSPFQVNVDLPRRVCGCTVINNDTKVNNVHVNVIAQEL